MGPLGLALPAAATGMSLLALRNGLRALVPESAYAACDIDPGARPETLAPAQCAALAALAYAPQAVIP
jgi:hypothetical protein